MQTGAESMYHVKQFNGEIKTKKTMGAQGLGAKQKPRVQNKTHSGKSGEVSRINGN